MAAHTDEYLRILKDMDEQDEQEELEETPDKLTREMIESKLKEAKQRLDRYESYLKIMEEAGASHIS